MLETAFQSAVLKSDELTDLTEVHAPGKVAGHGRNTAATVFSVVVGAETAHGAANLRVRGSGGTAGQRQRCA